jgi:dTDP-4-dehydrorhamnose reductase
MVTDVYENPVYVKQLVQAIWRILENQITGIVHISGETILSRYHLALKVASEFSLNEALIEKCTSKDFKHLAPRPLNTTFNTEKFSSIFSLKPLKFDLGLKLMHTELAE